jgi:hypothetical protein
VLAILLWLPHPVLGVNVGVGIVAAVIAARLPNDGISLVASKALLIGVALLLLGVVVDARTRSRAGSALHYMGVIAMAVGKVAAFNALGGAEGLGVAATLASLELVVALVDRRRSWAYSAWITLEFVALGLFGLAFGGTAINADTLGFVAPLLVLGAVLVQRRQEGVRQRILASLPPGVAGRFPA